MSVKCRFRGLFKKNMEKGPKTVEIGTTLLLPYLFIPLDIIQSENIYVSALQILKTVS